MNDLRQILDEILRLEDNLINLNRECQTRQSARDARTNLVHSQNQRENEKREKQYQDKCQEIKRKNQEAKASNARATDEFLKQSRELKNSIQKIDRISNSFKFFKKQSDSLESLESDCSDVIILRHLDRVISSYHSLASAYNYDDIHESLSRLADKYKDHYAVFLKMRNSGSDSSLSRYDAFRLGKDMKWDVEKCYKNFSRMESVARNKLDNLSLSSNKLAELPMPKRDPISYAQDDFGKSDLERCVNDIAQTKSRIESLKYQYEQRMELDRREKSDERYKENQRMINRLEK